MKKVIILIIYFCILIYTQNLFSQSGWFWQNPLPVGSNLTDIFFINNLIGYSVGWNGSVIKTTNSGTSWVDVYSNIDTKLYSLYFFNENTGFAVSGDLDAYPDGYLYKTSNGGQNWFSIDTFSITHLNQILFLNNNTGFIVGAYNHFSGRVFKTTNSGMNWVQKLVVSYSALMGIKFINDLKGYVCGDNGNVFKTSDCGESWSLSNNGISSTFLQSICFPDSLNGYVVGGYGNLFKTTNEGLNWNNINMNTTTSFWDIKFFNNSTGFIVGSGYYFYDTYQGSIFKTTNSGLTWDSTFLSHNIKKLIIMNSNVTVVGNLGTIFYSSNLGANWVNNNNTLTSSTLNKIFFINQQTGYIIGDAGVVLKTTNTGLSWLNMNYIIGKTLNNCYFLNELTGYVTTTATNIDGISIFKTTNGANSWDSIHVNTMRQISSIIFSGTSGYICANITINLTPYGEILKSTDLGNNWYQVYDSNNYVYNCSFINETTGYLCGDKGKVSKTTNGGINWIHLPISQNDCNFYDIKFINENTGFIGGYSNTYNKYAFFKTFDGGNNWINVTFPESNNYNQFYSFSFADSYHGFLIWKKISVPGGSDIIVTNDMGLNWQRYSNQSFYTTYYDGTLNSIFAINDSVAFAVGDGVIIKLTKNIHTIGVYQFSNKFLNHFSLSQNYPNPFNPTTKIKFDIPKSSFTKLVIFDILGREVATLVNEELKPGSYEYIWNGYSFASGVYFYKLMVSDPETSSGFVFSQTKRMVLIK